MARGKVFEELRDSPLTKELKKLPVTVPCGTVDPEMLFMADEPRAKSDILKQVKGMCEDCPVRAACLVEGLSESNGVWGGYTTEELRRLERSNGLRNIVRVFGNSEFTAAYVEEKVLNSYDYIPERQETGETEETGEGAITFVLPKEARYSRPKVRSAKKGVFRKTGVAKYGKDPKVREKLAMVSRLNKRWVRLPISISRTPLRAKEAVGIWDEKARKAATASAAKSVKAKTTKKSNQKAIPAKKLNKEDLERQLKENLTAINLLKNNAEVYHDNGMVVEAKEIEARVEKLEAQAVKIKKAISLMTQERAAQGLSTKDTV